MDNHCVFLTVQNWFDHRLFLAQSEISAQCQAAFFIIVVRTFYFSVRMGRMEAIILQLPNYRLNQINSIDWKIGKALYSCSCGLFACRLQRMSDTNITQIIQPFSNDAQII